MIGTPRIQARTGQVTESVDPTLIGKWSFEILISTVGSGEEPMVYSGAFFETEEEAKHAMRDAARFVTEKVSELVGAEPGKYVDLKQNTIRSWDEN